MGQIVFQLILMVVQTVVIKLAEIMVERMPEIFGKRHAKKVVAACKNKVSNLRGRKP